jgi:drug/metabolite transporter superfamily protein YnfA
LSKSALLGVLLLAALLEAGGDALVRHGLHSQSWPTRVGFMALGAIVLFAYAVSVNTPPWDFGRLLGVYVTLFFVVAQLINWFAFGVQPTLAIIVGGVFIVAGGLIVTVWN